MVLHGLPVEGLMRSHCVQLVSICPMITIPEHRKLVKYENEQSVCKNCVKLTL